MGKRFYVPELFSGKVKLPDFELHHAINVLRIKKGDIVELFDGKGKYAEGVIIGISKSQADILAKEVKYAPAPKIEVTLAFAAPKYVKQEILALMCSELGISRFQPVIFARSSVRETLRLEKWKRWAIQACKQSRRNYLPEICKPIRFNELARQLNNYDCVIYGEYRAECNINKLISYITGKKNIAIIVGPEGGFTDEEISSITKIGAMGMRIGKHVLRVETAAIAIISAVMTLVDSNS